MRRVLAGILLTSCSVVAAVSEPIRSGYTDHQVYDATRDQAVRAIENVFGKIGGGLLGADWENGVVVSKAMHADPSDVKSIMKVNPDSDVVYFFVALVEPRNQEQVEIRVLTVLSARTKKKNHSPEGGFFISGNALTEQLYDELSVYLGLGVLVPIGAKDNKK